MIVEKNIDTDNVFEKVFEFKYKYLTKIFKYYQIQMYFTPCLIYYIFELDTFLNMTPLDLKCCCNVFDHVVLTFKINRGHF